MDTNELKKWVVEDNIEEDSIKAFWLYIKNSQIEESEDLKKRFKDYDINLITLKLERIGYMINYRFDNIIEYIVVYIYIFYFGERIGVYESLYTIEGEPMDDFLTIF